MGKYTIDIARDTKDPKILTEILKRERHEIYSWDDSVSNYAACNPHCPKELLIEILRREEGYNYVSKNAAFNPNCPPEMLVEVLRRGNDDLISQYAALNPNCPPEILKEVLKRENDGEVSCAAVENINCPSEILAEVLKRGNNDRVSFWASINPNCPDEDKIKWMMKTGQIGKEDPSVHIIEYETIKEDDFQDLKDLL